MYLVLKQALLSVMFPRLLAAVTLREVFWPAVLWASVSVTFSKRDELSVLFPSVTELLCASAEEFCPTVLLTSVIFPKRLSANVTFSAREEFRLLFPSATELFIWKDK